MRKASSADAWTLAETRRDIWKETYRGIYPDQMLDGYDVEAFAIRDAARIANLGHHYYLFLDEGHCVGYFSFGPYNFGTYKDFDLCLNNLYIRGGYKGRGLGRKAFQILREYCREQGIDRFFCGCNINNLPAVAFYRHMGGVPGDSARMDVPKEDQIIHFEFTV